MGLFERFPYTNFHELNADWLLKQMKELIAAMENFKATESLKFADPIIWDITTQYQKSTIVLDPTGNAYLSVKTVPAGVQLNNDEYWLEIFNFTDYTRTANKNLTANVETNTTRATAAYNVDDWLIWEDVLYKVTAAIAIDDALVVGTNLIHFTVEDFIKAWITYANGLIQQYKNEIDISEANYRQQLANDVSQTVSNIESQLNTAIAGVTVDSEVINARVGWDNIVYDTLGDAVRTQVKYLNDIYDSDYTTVELKYLEKYTATAGHLTTNGFVAAAGDSVRVIKSKNVLAIKIEPVSLISVSEVICALIADDNTILYYFRANNQYTQTILIPPNYSLAINYWDDGRVGGSRFFDVIKVNYVTDIRRFTLSNFRDNTLHNAASDIPYGVPFKVTPESMELAATDNGWMRNDGTFNNDYVSCNRKVYTKNLKSINIYSNIAMTSGYPLAVFFDSTDTFITAINGNGTTTNIVNVPDDLPEDSYAIINFFDYYINPTRYYDHVYLQYKRPYFNYQTMVRKPFNFLNTHVLYTGDSITKGSQDPLDPYYSWPQIFSNLPATNHIRVNLATNGARLTDGDIVTQLTNGRNYEIANNITFDYIFIAAGINDFNADKTLAQVRTAIVNICNYLNSNFAGRPIIFITPLSAPTVPWYNNCNLTLDVYRQAITETIIENDTYGAFSIIQGNDFNFPDALDPTGTSYTNSIFYDGLHPNKKGFRDVFVPEILRALL